MAEIKFSFSTRDKDFEDLTDPEPLCITNKNAVKAFDTNGEVLFEKDGIKVINKGLVMGHPQDSDKKTLYWTMLFVNETGGDLYLENSEDSTFINGKEIYNTFYGMDSYKGESAWIEMQFDEYDLEELGIKDASEVEDIKMQLFIENDEYDRIAEPELKMKLK